MNSYDTDFQNQQEIMGSNAHSIPGVQYVADGISEKVDAKHDNEDRQTGGPNCP